MANAEPNDGWHAPATVDKELLEFAPDDTFNCEEQAPRSGFIALLSFTVLIFILGSMFALTAYWNWYYDGTVESANKPEPSQLKELRTRETQQLSDYRYLNRDKGVVQIPVDRAMQVIVQEAAEGKYNQNIPKPGSVPAAAATAAAGAATNAATGMAAPAAPAAAPQVAPAAVPPVKK
jgi:hypothetical protein